jgi:hypothetical protein
MSIAFIIGIPLLVATFITIYFWKKDSKAGFLGKTIPEFGRIWLWSLIFGIMIVGTVLNILIN